MIRLPNLSNLLRIRIPDRNIVAAESTLERFMPWLIVVIGSIVAAVCFWIYYQNGLGLAYNDARSHLDIGRRVVEGLKPGIAQLGSVWLPLPHILMIPTIWNDVAWHTGFSGAIVSMISFVATCLMIYKILGKLKVGLLGRIFAVAVFATNLNILYLQSTAMTELLLIATTTAAVFELINFHEDSSILTLVKSAFWIMLSTLVRYDGWFLFAYSGLLIIIYGLRKKNIKMSEGMFVLFCTMAGFGVFLWFLWNAVIFKDPLYFAFGPYSAHAQQDQLAQAGVLLTKGNWDLSMDTYWYAMVYNVGIVNVLLGALGAALMFFDKHISKSVRIASTALFAPLIFNIIALYFGHSVLFVQNLNGDTWFNVRYGIMMMPSIAIFAGYLVNRLPNYKYFLIGLVFFVNVFAFVNKDAVTIDDGRVGSSQKNVTEVSSWLNQNAANTPGFVLISAASHDAIIFSSDMPMKKFIHEGTGAYWLSATAEPDRWARWIVMRTNDMNDQTFKLVSKSGQLDKYQLMESYPFADVYQLKDEFIPQLNTEANLPKER